ncbi:Thiol-disulfide oxidoreductase ResA [Thalassoglobus neptunius]|uniref:Thiol-disulfide oxidoreductase ResA n=1 Tax=Thalassoglobus neptunius TaxID=1938619 RepID=A0A5C5X745_9PLAN|nr:TlpA disulfide reductase family protein [Thalassoglobus neptunius]TWT58760.1 Thiol-disulfide oxidoreductase ResA [Thalassoglobus neptunius]
MHDRLLPLLAIGLICWISGCNKAAEDLTPPTPEVPEAGSAVTDEPEESGTPTPAPAGQTEETENSEENSETDSETPSESTPVTLETKSWDETLKLVDQEQGKVVVMDLWSTSCPPCLEELPNLIKLSKEFPDSVTCISVSLDYAGYEDEPVESYRDSAMTWLEKFNANIQNILCSTDFNTIFSEKIPHSSLPVVLVYNQQGQLAGQFPDPKDPSEFTYHGDVIPFVKNLIDQ